MLQPSPARVFLLATYNKKLLSLSCRLAAMRAMSGSPENLVEYLNGYYYMFFIDTFVNPFWKSGGDNGQYQIFFCGA